MQPALGDCRESVQKQMGEKVVVGHYFWGSKLHLLLSYSLQLHRDFKETILFSFRTFSFAPTFLLAKKNNQLDSKEYTFYGVNL